MEKYNLEHDDDETFFEHYRGLIFFCFILLISTGIFFAVKTLSKNNQPSIRRDQITVVSLPPPPPPPKLQPTPPPQQQPTPEQQQEQKMVEQQPVQEEKKLEAPKEKPADLPAPLGTAITGPGGGQDLGLGSGLGGGGGYGTGSGGGTKYGWYASEVQNRVQDAVTSNPVTRFSSMSVVARIWVDPSGRVTKAHVSGGDPTLDAAVENQVLAGLRLADAPPADMPLPIVMRIGLRRP